MSGPSELFARIKDGFSRIGYFLHLSNPHYLARIGCPDTNRATEIDVAVAVSLCPVQHAGIFYRDRITSEVRIIHLGGHRTLSDDKPEDVPEFIWIAPKLLAGHANLIAAFCRLIAMNKPQISYGFRYDEASLFNMFDASFTAAPGTIGLTCATFVHAVLKSSGVRLLKTEEWPHNDPEAVAWQTDVVAKFRAHGHPHADALEDEIGSPRFTPFQIAASCLFAVQPVFYRHARMAVKRLRPHLMDYYQRQGLC